MNILVISQFYFPEQFRITDICENLVEKGNEVTVLTGLPNYPNGYIEKDYKWFRKRKEKIKGVNVIRCWEIGRRKGNFFRMLNYFSYAFSASIRTIFMSKKYDVVYVYQLSPILMAIPGIIYKKIYKKRLVLYCLDLWPESLKAGGLKESSKIYKIFAKISDWIYKSVDEILVTSKSFCENLKSRTNKEISYLPQYAESNLNLKVSNKKENQVNLIFAGNIGKAQSIDTIIKAAEIVQSKGNNIYFHIVGNGSELENCKKQAEGLNNIKFYGQKNINEMQYFYNMADAMLVTLSDDTFSNMTLPGKVQACMKTGNPIIAAANGETKMIIEEAQCGYAVNAENSEELAEAIFKFYSLTNDEISKMEENSINYYKNNFEKEIVMERLLNKLKNEGEKEVCLEEKH